MTYTWRRKRSKYSWQATVTALCTDPISALSCSFTCSPPHAARHRFNAFMPLTLVVMRSETGTRLLHSCNCQPFR